MEQITFRFWKKKGRDCVKPLYRTILFTIIFVLSYCIVFFLMRHEIDLVVLAVLTVVQFILNFVIYTVLEKVDKS